VVCPTDFKKDAFVFNGINRGGLSLLSDELYLSAAYADNYARNSGINGFKQTAVAKKLAGTVVQVSPVLDHSSAGLAGSTAARDMETLFQLVNMYFTTPNFTTAA
jgi:zinc protease